MSSWDFMIKDVMKQPVNYIFVFSTEVPLFPLMFFPFLRTASQVVILKWSSWHLYLQGLCLSLNKEKITSGQYLSQISEPNTIKCLSLNENRTKAIIVSVIWDLNDKMRKSTVTCLTSRFCLFSVSAFLLGDLPLAPTWTQMILWLLPDFSCLADAAHWLGDCAQLLCQSARLTIPIIIQIRTVNMVTVEKQRRCWWWGFSPLLSECSHQSSDCSPKFSNWWW